MRESKIPEDQRMEARVILVMPPAMKRSLYEVARRSGTSVSALARDGIAHMIANAA